MENVKFDKIIKFPKVSEKATILAKNNQYVFEVFPKATKKEIKEAIEKIYGVKVEKIQIVKLPSKKRRMGQIEGRREAIKKAIVRIKEGQKIEILPR
jgi:large subunit ribosomal protein L23